jgi:phenylalanyl-tRNA synthetase beta chain
VQARFELEGRVAVLWVDIDALDAAERKPARLRELSRFPKLERDLAVLLASDAPAGEVAAAIREAGGPALQHVEIFDRFAGRGVPEGRVSVAFRLVFQRLDRTLQEQEVTEALERVMTMLARRYGGELRERTAKQGEGS